VALLPVLQPLTDKVQHIDHDKANSRFCRRLVVPYDKDESNTERHIIEYFEALARHLPVDIFVLVGTFIEEVISPIPSFVVLIPAGAVASAQSLPLWYLLWLAALCGAGRVAGGSLLYWIAYRLEGAI
jgi:hypothetical protein